MIQAQTLGTAVQANYMSAGSPYYFFCVCVCRRERTPRTHGRNLAQIFVCCKPCINSILFKLIRFKIYVKVRLVFDSFWLFFCVSRNSFFFFHFFSLFFCFSHKLNSNNTIIGMFLSFPDARERSLGWRRKKSTSCWLVKSRDRGSIFSLISASEIQFETAKRAPHSCSE